MRASLTPLLALIIFPAAAYADSENTNSGNVNSEDERAEQSGDENAVPRYAGSRVVVELVGVQDELAQNVLAHLDLVRFADRDDLTALSVSRHFDDVPAQVGRALRGFGYYQPRTQGTLTREGNRFLARLEIDPGEPVRLVEVDVRVLGPGAEHIRFQRLLAQSPLVPNAIVNHREFDQVRGELESTAQSLGYFDHRFVQRMLEVHPEELAARIQLVLDPGERHRFGEVRFEQDILEPSLVNRLVPIHEGGPYDADLLIAAQYALADSEYFANVIVQAGDRNPDARTVPIHIQAEPAPRHRLSYGVGYGTDTQLRVRGVWELNRVNRLGHQVAADVRVSEPLREAVAHYIVPVGDPLTDRLAVRAAYVDEELADADSRRNAIGILHQRLLGEWKRNLFVDLVAERTLLPARAAVRDTLVVPGVAFERLYFDDPVLPSEGRRLYIEMRASHRALGSPTDFARVQLGASRLLSFGEEEAWSLLVQGALGLGWMGDFDRLPASQRFFAGGDESVRGYRYQALGTRDVDGHRVGGRHLMTASAEGRRRLGNWLQLAAFIDAGNAMWDFNEGLEVAVGVGVHLMTPLGRLRVEIAQSVTQSRSARLHLSIRPDL
jgi:translocation and assembly module TamA